MEVYGASERRGARESEFNTVQLDFREVRAGRHASHARLAQILRVSMYTDIVGPREW